MTPKDTFAANKDTEPLAIEGGAPVRTAPLPLEFPGIHYMDEEEVEAAVRLLRKRSLCRYYGIDLQREVEKFEAEFAAFIGVPHAVAVTSGTGGLNIALRALGVGPGQEVIVPAYLWVSVVGAVVNQGAIPVVADINETFCLDPKKLESSITPRTRGIIVVHMSGAPADIQAIQEVAQKHDVWLLEDCAQCNGGSINGQKVGTFGDAAIFSFQMNKTMTSGEGGCVVTNDRQLYHRIFACHDLGYARDENGRLIFDNQELRLWGLGCRLDELRAAVLRVQLRKLPRIIEHMHKSKYRIRQALQGLPEVRLRRIVDVEGDTGCFLITMYRDVETARWVNRALRAEGIVTHDQGVSNVLMTDWGLHIYYNNVSLVNRAGADGQGFPWNLTENAGLVRNYAKGACPAADNLFERSIILAVPSCLTEKDEVDIIRAFGKVLQAVVARP